MSILKKCPKFAIFLVFYSYGDGVIFKSPCNTTCKVYINILYDNRHCFADDIIYYSTHLE